MSTLSSPWPALRSTYFPIWKKKSSLFPNFSKGLVLPRGEPLFKVIHPRISFLSFLFPIFIFPLKKNLMPAKLRHSFFFVCFFFLLVFLFTLYYCFYLFVYYSPTSNLVACFFITWSNALTIFLFLCCCLFFFSFPALPYNIYMFFFFIFYLPCF